MQPPCSKWEALSGGLVTARIKAANRFLRDLEKRIPVVVAFWIKESEGGRWNLYVAFDQSAETKVQDPYQEVLRISAGMNDPDLEPFQVKLVGLSDPAVRAALEVYQNYPPKIPRRLDGRNFGGMSVEEVYLVRGPTGEYHMPSGREVLDQIIDQEAAFFEQHERPPRKIKLPVLMAYDLAKCGRDELGDLSGRVFKDGIVAFEKEGFHGMSVEIVRDRNATLQFE